MNPFHAHLHPLDWSFLALYLLFLLVIGFWRRRGSTEEYLIAGRSLSLPVFVATLVATWYGGILGAGEFVYFDGLAAWVSNGLPYYVFALLFALFLARKVRGGAEHVYTIPDKFAEVYDKRTALLAAGFAFIYASPAQYVLMTGTLLQVLFGWNLLPAMIVGLLFSVVYAYRGGFLADVRVNTFQFLLMFSGFLAITLLCLQQYGGYGFLAQNTTLPATHKTLLGTHDVGWLATWFFIALMTLTDPGFHQRCYAARTPRIAMRGILVAILCWFLFDTMTTTTGFFARALLPDLTDGKMAYPALAEKVLPVGLKGLFYVGMLAPIMASTISYTFISAMTVGRDLFWRWRNETDEAKIPHYTRIGMVCTCLLALTIALLVPSVVAQWFLLGNLFVPGMLLPILGAYAPRWRSSARFAFASMVCGVGTALVWLLIGVRQGSLLAPKYLLNLPPMLPGLCAALVLFLVGIREARRTPLASL
jgi:SSS family solute:Na+ symporter